jgi:4a-hydroxytetrahydrobiopterin dehydratase
MCLSAEQIFITENVWISGEYPMSNLSQLKCVACRGGEPALTDAQTSNLQPQVPEWQIKEVDGVKRLERVFKLKNFIEAVAFTNKIAMIAEKEDHHPLIVTEWGKVTVQWWTHKIKGLHQNDFIMAAKTDEISGQ